MKFDNLNDLRILVYTANTGSLTKASKALNLTPAAASAMLKRLEAQIGSRLFERSTRALRLTPEGKVLLEYANRAFDIISEGEAELLSGQKELRGVIRVTAPGDLSRALLLSWISEFLKLYPTVTVAFYGSDTVMDIMRNEVDIAFRYGELRDSSLIAKHLTTGKLIACAAPEYLSKHSKIKHPTDLLKHNCITMFRRGQNDTVWKFKKDKEEIEINVSGDRFVDDAILAREWALQGEGIVFLSSLNIANDLKNKKLIAILPNWETNNYPLNALMPSLKFRPKRIDVFIDFISKKFSKL